MSHMTKEERKANNIRNETQRRINAGDTSSYVQNQISSNPNTFTNVQPNQQGSGGGGIGPAGMGGGSFRPDSRPEDYGSATNQNQDNNNQNLSEDEINELWSKAQTLDEINKEKDKVPLIDQFDQFMTSFGSKKIPSLPSIATFGASALEGMNANSVLFKKLLEGSKLNSSDKVALVTLTNNTFPGSIISEYGKKNELSNDEIYDLSQKFSEQAREILGRVDDEEDNISDYIKRINDMGFGETVGTMYGDLTGQRDIPEGITTLENITDNLGSEGLAYLKLTDPKTFYKLRPAQTSEQMRDLANVAMPTGNSPEDRRFAAQIMEAREMAARSKESQDRASGITSIPSSNFIGFTPDNMNAAKYPEGYGAFLLNPPAPVRPGGITQPGFPDQDGDGVDDRYQAGPGIPRPGITKPVEIGLGIGSPKTNLPAAFNYANIAPQFTGSQYTNQGVSPAFLENLRRFYG